MADALDTIRFVRDVALGLASLDDRVRLSTAADEMSRLHDENMALKRENEELRVQLKRRKDIEYEGGSYYVILSDGEKAGPLCPRCYEDRGHIYLLERANGGARCSVCGTRYAGSGYAVEGLRASIC